MEAWSRLDKEQIVNSFKGCSLNLKNDGSVSHCFIIIIFYFFIYSLFNVDNTKQIAYKMLKIFKENQSCFAGSHQGSFLLKLPCSHLLQNQTDLLFDNKISESEFKRRMRPLIFLTKTKKRTHSSVLITLKNKFDENSDFFKINATFL